MIRYSPTKLLKKVAPRRRVAKLLNDRLAINQTILGMLSDMGVVSQSAISSVALKTARQYRRRVRDEIKGGATAAEARDDVLGEKGLLVARIQAAIVTEIAGGIRDQYAGESYTWLPSDSEEPDPEHQLNYGKRFRIGEGEMPGERWGCKCGMDIHVEDTELQLDEAA